MNQPHCSSCTDLSCRLTEAQARAEDEWKHRLSLQQTLNDWQTQIRRLQSELREAQARGDALQRERDALTVDRDEWREQHERLLVMYRDAEDRVLAVKTHGLVESTRALIRGTVKGFSAGENADAKYWRQRAEKAEARPPRSPRSQPDGSAQRIEQIRERVEKATRGPWFPHNLVFRHDTPSVSTWRSPATESASRNVARELLREDAEFVANAREDVPFLLQRLIDTEAQLVAVRDESERRFKAWVASEAALTALRHQKKNDDDLSRSPSPDVLPTTGSPRSPQTGDSINTKGER